MAGAGLHTRGLNVRYGAFHAVKNVSITVAERRLTSLIGPSGCGKSTLLRVFNRMNDLVPDCRIDGSVEVAGQLIYAPHTDIHALRKRVGMVFQRPNPFPLSIYENVIYGLRIHTATSREQLDRIAQ